MDEFIPSIQKLVLKHALVANEKKKKKDGIPCYSDSGSPLFVKKGKRHVQIGMKYSKRIILVWTGHPH